MNPHWERDGYCHYCGEPMTPLEFLTDKLTNPIPLCYKCAEEAGLEQLQEAI